MHLYPQLNAVCLRGLPRKSAALPLCAFIGLACVGSVHGQNSDAPAAASSDTIQLSTFEVRSEKDIGYIATNSVSGTVFATPIRELPISVSVVTAELLRDIGASNLQEMAQFLPGVGASVDARFPTKFTFRGFDNGSGILRDGFKRDGYSEAFNVDRVEFFQGPASLLYGQNQPGGVLNMITLKPTLGRNEARVATRIGSFDLIEGSFDLNTPLGGYDKAAVRIIAAEHSSEGWRNHVYLDKSYLDGQVLWQPFDRLQIRAEYEYGKRRGNSGSQAFQGNPAQLALPTPTVVDASAPGGTRLLRTGDPVGTGIGASLGSGFIFPISVLAPDYPPGGAKFNAGGEDQYYLGEVSTIVTEATLQVSSNIVAKAGVQFADQLSEIIFNPSNRWGNGGLWMPFGWTGNKNRSETTQVKVNIVGTYDFGPTKHQIVIGYDRDMTRTRNRNLQVNSPARFAWFFTDPFPRLADANPRWAPVLDGWNFNDGYYLADMVQALEGRLRLMGGVRRSTQHARPGQNEVSKNTVQGGLSYDLTSWLTPYVSYSESFIPINGLNADGTSFVPETGEGYDIGFKASFLNGRLSGTVAYFHIEKMNIRQNDLARTLDPANVNRLNYFNQGGLARSEGVQFEMIYSPTRHFQMQLAYAYTDAFTVRNDTLPQLAGQPLGLVAPHYASLVSRYEIASGPLKGLSFGASAAHSSKKNSSNRPDIVAIEIPAYTVAGAFVRYNTRIFGNEMEIGLQAKNLFDKFYYASSNGDSAPFVADPRSFEGTLRFRF